MFFFYIISVWQQIDSKRIPVASGRRMIFSFFFGIVFKVVSFMNNFHGRWLESTKKADNEETGDRQLMLFVKFYFDVILNILLSDDLIHFLIKKKE